MCPGTTTGMRMRRTRFLWTACASPSSMSILEVHALRVQAIPLPSETLLSSVLFVTSGGPSQHPLWVVCLLASELLFLHLWLSCPQTGSRHNERLQEEGPFVLLGWAKHWVLGSRLCPSSSMWLWVLDTTAIFISVTYLFRVHVGLALGACR